MSRTAIILIVIAVIIVLIIVYSMYKSAQAKALAAQQQAYNASYGTTTAKKVNVADIGNFLGGFITGLKTNADQQAATA